MNIVQEAARIKKDEINSRKGWFKREETRMLKDNPHPFTDDIVEKICTQILSMNSVYKVPDNFKSLLKYRDAALISMFWLFLKRANEVLRVKMEDITFTQTRLSVIFSIQKKAKRYKVCSKCKERSGLDSSFCKTCGTPLDEKDIKIFKAPEPIRVVKNKAFVNKDNKINQFIPFIRAWYNERLKLGKEGYLFSPLHVIRDGKPYGFDIHRKMTSDNLLKVLQRYSPAFCTHLFRYALTKDLIARGVSMRVIQKAGDWSSLAPIEKYAHSLGETIEDKEYERL